MEPLTILNNLRIASPCSASWEAMGGDDRVRFCDSCSKHVYDISGLTADDAVALIREAEGRVCIRLYRRRDGTILTADCPVGLRFALRRRMLRLATAGVVVFATLRSGLWLFTAEWPRVEIPAIPAGPGLTFADWADWAAQALGIKRTAVSPVTMGALCPPPPPNRGGSDGCEPGPNGPSRL